MSPHVVGFSLSSSRHFLRNHFGRISVIALLFILLFSPIFTTRAVGAERFYISIPGPVLGYVPLYYGQEKGFFNTHSQEPVHGSRFRLLAAAVWAASGPRIT